MCLDRRLEGNHKCRPDSGHDECCICLEVGERGAHLQPIFRPSRVWALGARSYRKYRWLVYYCLQWLFKMVDCMSG